MKNFDTIDHVNEKSGMVVGYVAAFVVDKFVKVSVVVHGCRAVGRIAKLTSRSDVPDEQLFEECVDGVTDAF